MPWVVGCDEAGYGPPLGCFTQASVAMKLPDSMECIQDTWAFFPALFRKRKGAAKSLPGSLPMVVDDSKAVTQLTAGIGHMAALWPMLFANRSFHPRSFQEFLDHFHLPGLNTYSPDPVFEGNQPINWWETNPRVNGKDPFEGIGPPPSSAAKLLMMCPAFFNRVIDETGNKGAVLELGWKAHIAWWLESLPQGEPIVFISDRLGGKKSYTGLFQDAISGQGLVQALGESDDKATYKVLGGPREMLLIVTTKADSGYLPVAAASMLAKHIREYTMDKFNAFWTKHIPGITPTAGYPEDGKRYYQEIKPVMEKLGIPETSVWRKR